MATETIDEDGNRVINVKDLHGDEVWFHFRTGIDFSRIIDAYNSNDASKINAAKDITLAEMESAEKRLVAIQLANKGFDAGRFWEDGKWHEYFPHEDTTKDQHNEWCHCKLCKADHDTCFDYCGTFVRLCDKLHDIAIKNPENLSWGVRGEGLDGVKCVICGKGGLNNNIAAFVNTKEEGEKIIRWLSRYHAQWLDYRPREPNHIQAKVGACDKHRDFFDALFKHARDGVVSKAAVNAAFDEYKRLHENPLSRALRSIFRP